MIPKAELHCHLEGSIAPALARELAQRNGLDVPIGLIGERGHYVWKDFLSFLAAYDLVCTTLRTARDFGDVAFYRFLHVPVCQFTHPDDKSRDFWKLEARRTSTVSMESVGFE